MTKYTCKHTHTHTGSALVNRFTHSQSCLCAVLCSPFNNLNTLGTRFKNCVQKTAQCWYTDHLWCYFINIAIHLTMILDFKGSRYGVAKALRAYFEFRHWAGLIGCWTSFVTDLATLTFVFKLGGLIMEMGALISSHTHFEL